MKKGTRYLHTGWETDPFTGAVNVPIYQTSIFDQSTDKREKSGYHYSRLKNPTREALEGVIAELEEGRFGFAFSSGMAAISSALLLFSPGDHLVVTADLYGGAYNALTGLFKRIGLEISFVDTTNLRQLQQAVRENTRAIYLETPSNPLLNITDLEAVVSLARSNGLRTMLDNTFMTPHFQQPLEYGIDVVLHSATKYLGGHSDLIAGLAVANDPSLAEELRFLQVSFGAIPGPFDCWLVMRGIKTLHVRMEQHQKNAQVLAEWLQGQPRVKQVYYPGLLQHPYREIHERQASGPGGIVSFRLESAREAEKVLNSVKIPAIASSLGGVESILSHPATMSHASMPEEYRQNLGITGDLLRYSVGLEDPEDMIADLEQALEQAME